MTRLKDGVLASLILVVTFLVFFLLTTVITDAFARWSGFYTEGQQAEIGLYE